MHSQDATGAAFDPRAQPRAHILSHTSLRGVAALLVIFYHLQLGGEYRFGFESATPFFAAGYLWVDLFFVLSGFIITYTNSRDGVSPLERHEIRRFAISRFARIYPLHLFCLAYLVMFEVLLALVMPGSAGDRWNAESLRQLGAQLLLVHATGIGGDVGWNVPSWSISAEAFAYICFPLLLGASLRSSLFPLLMALLSLGFYTAVMATTGDLDITTGWALMRCLAGFMLGMILHQQRHRFSGLGDATLTAWQLLAVGGTLAGLLLDWNDVLLIPFFVLLVGSTWTDRGALAKVLAKRPLVWLGETSYSIYLNHVPLLLILWFFWSRASARLGLAPPLERGLFIAIAVGTVLMVSALTFRFVEKPARSWISRRFRAPIRMPEVPSAP